MKHVLMIAYSFPPEGNAGTYRPLRFVRQLPHLGWVPTVISAIPSQYERYDPALLRMVPNEVEVIRVKAYDRWQAFQAWRSRKLQRHSSRAKEEHSGNPQNGQQRSFRTRMRGMVHNIEAWWYHPDMAMSWIDSAVDATVTLCRRSPIEVIWATAGPVSSLVVAQRSSVRTGIPYVMDFRDPWTITLTNFELRRPKWARRLDRRRMFSLLQGAQSIIFRHMADAECFWHAYPKAFEAGNVHLIPNGYDGEIEEFVAPVGEKCTILYTGTITGAPYRYDTLLQSLSLLKQVDPAHAKQLRLLFVGAGTEILKGQAEVLGISDIVEVTGHTQQDEVARLGREAHALLALGLLSTHPGYELLLASKVFGYIKAGRPIIGVLPSDETKNCLKRVGVTTIADVNSVPEITRVLCHVLDSWSKGALSSLLPDRKACKAFSAEVQTAALVGAFEGKPAMDPFIPGLVDIPASLRGHIGKEDWLN